MVEPTHLKNISQHGNLPQVGVKKKTYLKPPPREILIRNFKSLGFLVCWSFGANRNLKALIKITPLGPFFGQRWWVNAMPLENNERKSSKWVHLHHFLLGDSIRSFEATKRGFSTNMANITLGPKYTAMYIYIYTYYAPIQLQLHPEQNPSQTHAIALICPRR